MPSQASPAGDSTKESSTTRSPDPVIIEVGRRSKGQISKLRQGRGSIRRDIDGALGQLRESGDLSEGAQVVIVVVRQQESPKDEGSCFWW